MAAGLGVEPDPAEVAAFADSVGDWPAFPDSSAALARLHERFRLGVITNCDDDLFARSAARLGIDFDWVVTAQQVGRYKPDERNFELAFERIGLPRERILHVAQSLYHDHVTAKRLGLSTVWIDRRHGRPGSGATPPADATPDATYPDMASFAEAATAGRLAPDPLEIEPHLVDALVVEAIDAPRPLWLLDDQTGVLEQSQVARHGRPADRQGVGELLDGPSSAAEQLDDRPPVRVARASNGSQRGRPTPSDGPHLVVLRVVGQLGQSERLHQRRHVDAEPAAQALLEPVPATERVVGATGPTPRRSPPAPASARPRRRAASSRRGP